MHGSARECTITESLEQTGDMRKRIFFPPRNSSVPLGLTNVHSHASMALHVLVDYGIVDTSLLRSREPICWY